jgi:ribonuclease P protein component
MLKKNKIRKNHEFQTIINSKKQIVSRFLIMYYQKNETQMRLGISVSKKFINAVGRNKIRRQVRSLLDEINAWEKKYNIVLIVRKPFIDLYYLEKKRELEKMIGRL